MEHIHSEKFSWSLQNAEFEEHSNQTQGTRKMFLDSMQYYIICSFTVIQRLLSMNEMIHNSKGCDDGMVELC